jgi:hypothetical protein
MEEQITVTLSREGIIEFLSGCLSEIHIDEITPHITILEQGQIHFVLGDCKLLIEVTDIDRLLN